jgi:hypothetical protein
MEISQENKARVERVLRADAITYVSDATAREHGLVGLELRGEGKVFAATYAVEAGQSHGDAWSVFLSELLDGIERGTVDVPRWARAEPAKD